MKKKKSKRKKVGKKASGQKKPTGSCRPSRSTPGGTPKIELVTVKPREPSAAERIENALSNPARYVNGILQASLGIEAIDNVLLNIRKLLGFAWERLDALSREWTKVGAAEATLDDRIRARSIIKDLNEWLMVTVLQRKSLGADPIAPATLTDKAQAQLVELAAVGRRLAMAWVEFNPVGNQPSLKLEDIPELDENSGEWVPSKKAAKKLNVTAATLGNYRYLGRKTPDGLGGLDVNGRVWRKSGPLARVWYFLVSLG